MPITTTFQANFTAFTTAVAVAQTKLISFESDAKKVEGTLSAMEKSISGVPIMQAATIAAAAVERLGGVSKLTYDELQRLGNTAQQAVDKMNALGDKVPTGIQSLADHARGASEEMLRLGGATEKTGDGFKSWAGKLDFKSVLNDPLGTAKEGVLALAESMGPGGVMAAKVIAGVAAVGGALIHLANQAQEVGRSIGEMGAVMDIPVEALSDLRFAVVATGTDFNTVGDSMSTFQKRMEDNGDTVKKGVEKIGLSFDSLKNMRPDEQLLAISDAMRATGADTNKTAVAFEIFGPKGKEMAKLLMEPLRELSDESKKLGATWSTEDVAAARAFTDATSKLAAETEAAWNSLGKTVAPVMNEIVLRWDQLKLKFAQGIAMPFEGWAAAFGALKGAIGENALADEQMNAVLDASTRLYAQAAKEGLNYADQSKQVATAMLDLGYKQENVARVTGLTIDKVRELAGELKNARTAAEQYNDAWTHIAEAEAAGVPSIEGLSTATKNLVLHYQELGIKAPEITAALHLSAEQQKLITEEHNKGEIAAKKYGDAWEELNSMGATYADTVAALNPKIAQQATHYLETGASVATVAAAFPKLSAAAVKALDEMVKADKKFAEEFKKNELEIEEDTKRQTDKMNATVLAGLNTIQRAQAEAKDFHMKTSMDTTSYQVMKIWETVDAQEAAFARTGASAEQVAQYRTTLWQRAAEEQAAIEDAAYGHMKDVSEKVLVDVVAVANKIKGVVDDTVGQMKQAKSTLETLQGGVKLPGSTEERVGGVTYVISPTGQRIALGPHGELPDSFYAQYAGESGFNSGYSNQPRIGTGFVPRAGGGTVTAGQPYLVGERRPELFVPASSGTILPNAQSGGVSVMTNIYVTQPLGTPAQIADVVGRAMMQSLRTQGVRLPSSV